MATSGGDLTYYFSLFIGVLATLLFYLLTKRSTGSQKQPKLRFPPGPPALPIIGHLHLLRSKTLPVSLEALATQYGPVMQVRMGGISVYIISNAILAEEILKTHDVDFASRFALGFNIQNFDIYEGLSFFNSDYGPYWRFMKKLCMTQLFAGVQLVRFNHIREDETRKYIKSLMQMSKDGQPCETGKELQALAQRIICRMAIGKRCAENPNLPVDIRKLVKQMIDLAKRFSFTQVFSPLWRWDPSGTGKKLESVMWEYDGMMEDLMKIYEGDRRKSVYDKDKKDVMDLLLDTLEDPNAEMKLTKNHIKKFFLEIFFAGVDTTAATIQFALIELINNPEMLFKLREEINSVVGSKRLVQESDIPKLPYLQAIIKETLRYHPAGVLIRRQCNVDTKIDGYDIKAGTKILINGYTIMRDPERYEEPEKFIPERFLPYSAPADAVSYSQSYQMHFRGLDFHFIPFGSGRRACLGVTHAVIVTHMVLAALVQCFDWKFKDSEKVDIKLVSGYTGQQALPIMCYPITRFDAFKM